MSAKYIWVTSGIKNDYYEIVEMYPIERISISDIPKLHGNVNRYKYIKGEVEPQEGSKAELMLKFKSAHDALWGGGALAPTTAFDELDKLIFVKYGMRSGKTTILKPKVNLLIFKLSHIQKTGRIGKI